MKLREFADADWSEISRERPTQHRTEKNTHPLHCSVCGELYYVDDRTIERVMSAAEGDPGENPFCCDDCLEEEAEEGRR